MNNDYHFETFAFFPARLLALAKETKLTPYEIYGELNKILAHPDAGDTVTPFYSDIKIHTINVGETERHILYAIDKPKKIVILIEASKFNLRFERQKLLYSLAALYELRKARKLLFKIFTAGLVE